MALGKITNHKRVIDYFNWSTVTLYRIKYSLYCIGRIDGAKPIPVKLYFGRISFDH